MISCLVLIAVNIKTSSSALPLIVHSSHWNDSHLKKLFVILDVVLCAIKHGLFLSLTLKLERVTMKQKQVYNTRVRLFRWLGYLFTHLVSLSEYSLVEKVGCVARHQLRSICHFHGVVIIMNGGGLANNCVVP